MDPGVSVLVISGSMGAGKTTVLGEASDLLARSGIAHAAIDLDALGTWHLPAGAPDDLTYRNLAAVWANYASAGVTRLLIAGAVESAAELERIRAAVPGGRFVIVRLTAPLETMRQRIRGREPGINQDDYLARVAVLDMILESAALESRAIANDASRSITDVARTILAEGKWL
jgi:predicted kinase